ncbi:MAG TPA: HNH endonuclease family protein [Streptosporangiaceae bacterium]|jgi:hypothetical protein
MAGKGGDHPFATGLVYVVGLVIAVFVIGRLTHTDLLGLARDGSSALSRALGGGKASSADLRDVKVAKPGSASGYGLSKFPDADSDANGCPTRDDVLGRDLSGVKRHGPCTVASGTLTDPYTGRSVAYISGHADTVRIEHVVALRTAWRSGASGWGQDRRTRFANDPDTLLAVDATAARDRAGRGPGEWRPSPRYQCAFAQRYVTTLHDYGLTVTKADHDALATMLGRC